jgi:hypothetical protein
MTTDTVPTALDRVESVRQTLQELAEELGVPDPGAASFAALAQDVEKRLGMGFDTIDVPPGAKNYHVSIHGPAATTYESYKQWLGVGRENARGEEWSRETTTALTWVRDNVTYTMFCPGGEA